MSLSSCPKCWDYPCMCGHEYKRYSIKQLETIRNLAHEEIVSRNLKESDIEYCRDSNLWNAEEDCNGRVISAPGGGIKCTECDGWFCF